jgi:hypothetical protein
MLCSAVAVTARPGYTCIDVEMDDVEDVDAQDLVSYMVRFEPCTVTSTTTTI